MLRDIHGAAAPVAGAALLSWSSRRRGPCGGAPLAAAALPRGLSAAAAYLASAADSSSNSASMLHGRKRGRPAAVAGSADAALVVEKILQHSRPRVALERNGWVVVVVSLLVGTAGTVLHPILHFLTGYMDAPAPEARLVSPCACCFIVSLHYLRSPQTQAHTKPKSLLSSLNVA